jgi:hypothetical protein
LTDCHIGWTAETQTTAIPGAPDLPKGSAVWPSHNSTLVNEPQTDHTVTCGAAKREPRVSAAGAALPAIASATLSEVPMASVGYNVPTLACRILAADGHDTVVPGLVSIRTAAPDVFRRCRWAWISRR